MKASYTAAARYRVRAVCVTPLRTGGTDGDSSSVLCDHRGRAFVQGSSIAGALRNWLEESHNRDVARDLFGSQTQAGSLIVSDGIFSADSRVEIRPGLRINGKTGSAADGGKFDVAHVGTGSTFDLTLTWLGSKEKLEELSIVERMLSALNSGAICLGAQWSNGFGRVKLSVNKQFFDLSIAQNREAWLEDQEGGEALVLPRLAEENRVIFTLTGHADSILVKAAAPEYDEDKRITVNLSEGGRPVLPGSSVKGAVRARATAIAKLLELPESELDALFGRMNRDGDNGKAGRIRFEDVALDTKKKQRISRIRINRFTGGVMRGSLFTEEPLSSAITLGITAPMDEPRGCALLLYALRDLGLGLYTLGSGSSVGRGQIKVDTITAQLPDGKQAKLVFSGEGSVDVSDPDGIFSQWLTALKGERV